MVIKEKEIILKNGKKVLIRSATEKYAESLCNHRYITSSESYFMARYPEKMNLDITKMKNNLLTLEKDEKDFLITAFLDGKIIGDAGITKVRDQMKYGHRGYFGISIILLTKSLISALFL